MTITDDDGDQITTDVVSYGVEISVDQKTSGGYATVVLTHKQATQLGKQLIEIGMKA